MDVLTGKSKKDYTYVSRYASLPYYYNSNDKRYVYGLSKHLRQDTEYVLHHIADTDTLDSLALKYYGRRIFCPGSIVSSSDMPFSAQISCTFSVVP